jgi:hypothetical protein
MSRTLTSIILLCTALTFTHSTYAASSTGFYLGAGFSDFTLEEQKTQVRGSFRAFQLNFGYKLNDYISINAALGSPTSDTVIEKSYDTYINQTGIGEFSELQKDAYESSIKITEIYDLSVIFQFPIYKNLSGFTSFGYQRLKTKYTTYGMDAGWVDLQPSNTPVQDDFNGVNECTILGSIQACNQSLITNTGDVNSGGFMATVGFGFQLSTRSSARIGYAVTGTDEFDKAGSFISLSVII